MIALALMLALPQNVNPFDRLDPKPTLFSGAAKLVIFWHWSGLTTVDYPNQARCEQARTFVQAEVRRRVQAGQAAAPQGYVPIGLPEDGAFCVPG